jgi:hypothetical protein
MAAAASKAWLELAEGTATEFAGSEEFVVSVRELSTVGTLPAFVGGPLWESVTLSSAVGASAECGVVA